MGGTVLVGAWLQEGDLRDDRPATLRCEETGELWRVVSLAYPTGTSPADPQRGLGLQAEGAAQPLVEGYHLTLERYEPR